MVEYIYTLFCQIYSLAFHYTLKIAENITKFTEEYYNLSELFAFNKSYNIHI